MPDPHPPFGFSLLAEPGDAKRALALPRALAEIPKY